MSGYVGPHTRFIFRSESAKFNIFIQMATEMWDFDEDGELYYEKALSGFLPELDRRWKNIPANHVVSVIVFARVHYDVSELHMLEEYELPLRQEEGGKKRWYIDYYKVLVDLESDCNWSNVLTMLKEEFFRFSHDVLLLRRPVAGPVGAPWLEEQHADLLRRDRALLAGTLSSSHEGNILEAVNLSLNPFDEHYIDRDLNRTGLNILVITAGTGHFDVNKQLLRLTTERLIDNGIALDLVCLTKMPLHSVPLFHFQSQVPLSEIFTPGVSFASSSGFKSGTSRSRRGTLSNPKAPSDQNPPPDPLYFDPKHSSATALSTSHGTQQSKPSGLVDFYGIPHWVDCSFYNLQQDKPFRADRFIPRCKMHEVQMLGLMENEISDISIPYINFSRIPGIIAKEDRRPSLYKNHSNNSTAAKSDGSANTKHSRSYILASETFGDLTGLTVKEQNRIMREKFDKETLRDLEDVPSTLRSWISQGAANSSGIGLSSSPNPIRGSSYASTGSRRVPSSERGSSQNKESSQQVSRKSSSRSPSVPMRGPRTVLVTSPRLESHDEHPIIVDVESPTVDEQEHHMTLLKRNRVSLMSSVESLTSLGSSKGDGTWTPSSNGSSRGIGTLNGGLRPLKSMGKARAMVAPSQVDFDTLPVSPPPGAREANDSPAHRKASSLLFIDVTPEKQKKGYKSWLWGSFRGAAKDSRGITVDNDKEQIDDDIGNTSTSEASRKIQLLLKTRPMQHSPSAVSSSTAMQEKAEEEERSEADEGVPSPILIPAQAASAAATRSKGVSESQYLGEQDFIEQQAFDDEEVKAKYAQHAQVEKQTLVNPSNPQKSLKGSNTSQLIRWQHLFPRRLNQHVVKWRSMTTPACLPLTTIYLPTEYDLQKQWQEYPYQISISSDTSSFLVKRASSTHPALAVLREMTSQRLAQGFQFIVPAGKSVSDGLDSSMSGNENEFRLREPWELFQPGNLASGNPVFLSMTNQIHRISYDRGTNSINVKRYVRKTEYDTSPLNYACCIWSRNLPGYQTVQSIFHYPDSGAYNWTFLDALIAGYSDDEEFGSATKYWRTRFVVVPSEGSPPSMKGSNGEDLSDEEVRLLGMDRLADLFGRARWRPKQHNISKSRQIRSNTDSAAPLRFIPTSLDPAMSLRDGEFMRRVEAAFHDDSIEADLRRQKRESLNRTVKDLDYASLVRDMYSSTSGLKINDRLWNRIMYRESFSGADFVTWLCREYDDVKTREEATEWGNRFIREQVLQHVHDYHGFLDGHYFYRLTPQYFALRPNQSDKKWFASSSAKTKGGENGNSEVRSNSVSREIEDGESAISRMQQQQQSDNKGRRVLMSRSMIVDVDSNRKSDRAEVALLHYDIAHNPANGFNFQIHWLGTTARFIEDTVQSWTRSVERFGLHCIEAPINQIKDVSRHNPFQSPLPITLALHPPALAIHQENKLEASNNTEAYHEHSFQYALLRRFGFILDQEASEKYANITQEIDIEYKSRPNTFDFSQFVHRSGVAFVQVLSGNEGFLWLDNRLFNSHLHHHQQQDSSSRREDQMPSADSVRRDFIDFCGNVTKLEAFYRDVLDGLEKTWQEAG
jgi:hypothetical protein